MSEELLLLNKHLQLLVQYLRVRKQKKFPVHILIGQPNSGKTSLLRSLDIDFDTIIPAIKNYKADLHIRDKKTSHVTPQSEYCHWWLTERGVILDVPSHFLSEKSDAINETLWSHLLDFFKRNQRFVKLHSIIYVTSMHELIAQDKAILLEQITQDKQKIYELSRHLNTKLPLYFMITKMDYIAGFSEFFDHLRSDERMQSLGCRLQPDTFKNADSTNPSLVDTFQIRFDELISQLQTHVITLVHHERNLHKRTRIAEFPIQLEILTDALTFLITELGEKADYADAVTPQGIYFASTIQENNANFDSLQNSIAQQFNLNSENPSAILNHHTRSYFIQNFFTEILQNAANLSVIRGDTLTLKEKIKTHSRFLSLSAGCSAFLLLIILGLSSAYKETSSYIQVSSNALSQAKNQLQLTSQSNNLFQTIEILSCLIKAKNNLNNMPGWLHAIDAFELSSLQNNIDHVYQKTLENLLLPELQSTLENTLMTNRDPNITYPALKAYLMLGNLSVRQSRFIASWAQQTFKANLASNPGYDLVLTQATQDLFIHSNKTIKLNNLAIAQANNTLSNLPNGYLGYLILFNQAQSIYQQKLYVSQDSKQQLILSNDAGVPYFFTKMGYQNIFLPQLTALVSLKNNDLWVLQSLNNNQLLLSIANSAPDIIQLYFKNYAATWQNYLNRLFVSNYSFADVSTLLNNVNSEPQMLKQMLLSISDNLNVDDFNDIARVDSKNLANLITQGLANNFPAPLIATQQIIATYANSNAVYQNLQNAFVNLNTFVQSINTSANPLRNAFEAAELHATNTVQTDALTNLYNLANTVPQPMQSWLSNIANSTWQTVLGMTKIYINQRWQNEVMPFYNASVLNRFPIFSNSASDVSLADFGRFFAPNGVLDSFYNNYLQPFIDTSGVTWQWRTINNQSIALNAATPQLFERARVIRQMFFPNNQSQMQTQFALEADQVAPTVTRMQLSIGNQSMLVTPGQHSVTNFTWPDNNLTADVSILLNGYNTPNVSDNKNGPFALFRLLNDTTVATTSDPRRYIINFSISGSPVAQYVLTTNNEINPFIPNILNQFRCSPTL